MKRSTVATDPIQSLVTQAQQGDRAAFDKLVSSLQGRLRSAVASRIGAHLRHKLEVDDVLQETFARAFQSVQGFRWQGEDSFYRWLRGISEHLILHAADRHKRELLLEPPRHAPGSGATGVTASKAMRREERFERLQKALESLSPDHREVIMLARIEGLQMSEIAQRMDRSTSAVKNLLFRALRELKRRFGDTESFHLPDRSLRPGGEDEE